jgi:hypothetical protein
MEMPRSFSTVTRLDFSTLFTVCVCTESSMPYSSILEMEATSSFEAFADFYRIIWRYRIYIKY